MFETYILPVLIFGLVGVFGGVVLTIASRVFAVKSDERMEAVAEALPQINCGACGYAGCGEYAEAVINGGAPINLCKAGGKSTAEKLSALMGVDAGDTEEQFAVVHCGGHNQAAAVKYIFAGTPSCQAAGRFYSGNKQCTHGCLGFGDCSVVCPSDAITVENGLARISRAKCIGCGLCVKTCPQKIIAVHRAGSFVDVTCSSTEMGKVTKSVCSHGCIGCKLCEKKCPAGAIKVEKNLARIDYSLCTNCGLCVKGCPTKAIEDCRIQSKQAAS